MPWTRLDRAAVHEAARSTGRRSNWSRARHARSDADRADGTRRHRRQGPEDSQPESRPYRGRPASEIESVCLEEGKGDSFEAKSDARGVRDFTIRGSDVERRAEMVLMVVAGNNRRQLLRRGYGNDNLELQRLLLLARREHGATTSEERVVGNHGLRIEADGGKHCLASLEPQVPELLYVGRCSRANIFMHPKICMRAGSIDGSCRK